MEVAILLSSLIGQDKYAMIIVSINTLPESMVAWSYVANIFVGECNRLKLVTEPTKKLTILDDSGQSVAVTGRPNNERRNARRPRGGSLMGDN